MPVLCRGARRCHAVDDIQKLVRSFLIFVLPLSLRDQDLLDQFFTQWVPSVPRGMIGDFYFPEFHGHVSKAVSEAIHKCDGPVHRLNESDDDFGESSSESENEDDITEFQARFTVQLRYGHWDTKPDLVYKLEVLGEGGLVKTIDGYPFRDKSQSSLVGLLEDMRRAVRRLQPCRGVAEIPTTTLGWANLMKRYISP